MNKLALENEVEGARTLKQRYTLRIILVLRNILVIIKIHMYKLTLF